MRKNYDVVVVGGGIVGLSIAYQLLKRRKKVMIIEKNEIGSGASGACDDMILLQSKKLGISLEMAIESLNMYKIMSKELRIDIEYESRGGMILIENQRHLSVMEEYVEKQKCYGLDVEIIDQSDVYRKQPHVRQGILASTYSATDAQVNPLRVMRGFLARGSAMGLELRKHVNISEIKQKSSGWKLVLEDGTYVETEYIVNAAGAWAPEIGRLVDIHIPIRPKKGQVVITEQIPRLGDTNVWSAEYIVAKLKPELADEKKEEFKRLGIGFALSQASCGNYLIGSTREEAGFDKGTNPKAIQLIVNQAIQFFPILSKVHLIRTFAGFRPATEDGKAILGKVENRSGFCIAAGHEGDGIALAPVTGKLIADLIDDKSIHYNMEELKLERFRQEEVECAFA
ncbi:sarcosine oxidase subunit beta [Anaerosolibacter carboniphilus]|uniref:Sarcosine oxidase subunit beta n=1 Tax=Anaerosolibacter carboniphilus TaxID=1417629 RepID=A0A841KTN2_9FIRM|nr:FAD-dependent oxidoreductase [Anaerosolibacter carboniphilus]MBB6217064.1 sarcosine oxidase subunit beta [Anaerosolibacter carboniphilus]